MSYDSRQRKLKSFYKEGIDGNRAWRTKAKRNKNFYKGVQWDSKDVTKLDAEDRPHLTFNQIFPVINLISGYQRQNRQDIKVYPKKGGMKQIADVLTAVAKNISDTSNSEYLTSMVFYDGIISGKAWFDLDISYDDEPINGEIIMRRASPFDIIEDPNCSDYDTNACKYIIKTHWWDKEAIKLAYPKARDLDAGL